MMRGKVTEAPPCVLEFARCIREVDVVSMKKVVPDDGAGAIFWESPRLTTSSFDELAEFLKTRPSSGLAKWESTWFESVPGSRGGGVAAYRRFGVGKVAGMQVGAQQDISVDANGKVCAAIGVAGKWT